MTPAVQAAKRASSAGRPRVSAGRRGLQIELAPPDLIRLTDATVAELS